MEKLSPMERRIVAVRIGLDYLQNKGDFAIAKDKELTLTTKMLNLEKSFDLLERAKRDNPKECDSLSLQEMKKLTLISFIGIRISALQEFDKGLAWFRETARRKDLFEEKKEYKIESIPEEIINKKQQEYDKKSFMKVSNLTPDFKLEKHDFRPRK